MKDRPGPGRPTHQRFVSASAFLAADKVEHGTVWWSGAAQIATSRTGSEQWTRDLELGHHAMLLALDARGSDCSYSIDGGANIEHRVRRGDFTFLPAGHRLQSSFVGTTRYLAIVLDRNALHEDVLRSGIQLPDDLGPRILGRADPVATSLLEALGAECRNPGYADSLYCSYLAHTLLVHLVLRQNGDAMHSTPEPLNRFRIERLHEYIEEHIASRLSLAELATVVDVGPAHLSRLFKRTTAMPLHQYVLARRLARARTLLLRSDTALSEIALMTGFSSQSHLTSVFSRHVGATPSRFRRRRGLGPP
jgi:AraC family transcriptional regulator